MTTPRPLARSGRAEDGRRSLLDALRAGCRGTVQDTDAERASAAFDFGAGITKTPLLVVRAADAEDVVHVVRTARAFGVPVTSRATAHSLAGQALSDGGIALDLRRLSHVARCDPEQGWVDADAGAVWSDVVESGMVAAQAPPVLTSNLFTSVGGTHSVGGLGPTSFRHGIQADHCLGMEVVTAAGERVWCAPGAHEDLFDAVRCGLGLFGVMTRARVAVAPHPRTLWSWRLVYREVGAMLADLLVLADQPSVCRLSGAGRVLPRADPRWAWWTDVSVAGDGPLPNADALAGTTPALRSGPHVRAFSAVVGSGDRTDLREQRVVGAFGHPWVDVLLPAVGVAPYVLDAAQSLPAWLLAQSRVLFWPVVRRAPASPLFMTPPGEQIIMTSIMPSVRRAAMAEAGRHMLALLERGIARGGKQYVYGWVPQGSDAWARHFGPAWPAVLGAKRRHDPAGVFHPELLRGTS